MDYGIGVRTDPMLVQLKLEDTPPTDGVEGNGFVSKSSDIVREGSVLGFSIAGI